MKLKTSLKEGKGRKSRKRKERTKKKEGGKRQTFTSNSKVGQKLANIIKKKETSRKHKKRARGVGQRQSEEERSNLQLRGKLDFGREGEEQSGS